MKRSVLSLAALALAFMSLAASEEEPFRKKAIACSWDLGNFSFADILSNKSAFAAMPFDGARLYPNGAKGPDGNLLKVSWPMRGAAWPTDVFDGLVPTLREVTAMRPFRHSFLGLCISSGKKDRLDIRDDAAWRRAFGNVRLIARLARQGGCKGLIVDPEDYGGGRQYYRLDVDPPLDEALPLARRRGREFAEAIFGEFPEATVLSYWLWSARRGYLDEPGGVASAVRRHGDLWYAFLDGVLDGISPQGRLVDGDEYSYNYNPFSGTRFTYTDCLNRNRACIAGVSPENRMKFRAHVLMGCALYLDRYTNAEGSFYYSGPVSGSRLLHFDENFTAALQAADEYVWLWAEKHAWIDWKVHGPAVNRIAFTEHQTWNDRLPGIYDSILSTLDPERFLTERFPALRGRTTCTNVFSVTEMTVSGRQKDGRGLAVRNAERADRYVIECEASGDAPGVETAFSSAKGRQWGIAPVRREGPGKHRYLVKILPETVRTGIRCYTTGGTNAVANFTGIAAYRLPREDGYYLSGDWALDIAGRATWFSLDGGETADELPWLASSPMPSKVTRDADGRMTLTSSYAHPDHPDWAWTRTLSFTPNGTDEMDCAFFETRANRPGGDIRAHGVARRIPPPPKRPDLDKLKYGEPVDLLKDGLKGWGRRNRDKESHWTFKGGVLENHGAGGANIRTKRNDFEDFKLSFDVRADKDCNSGVYLRGIYEIQIADSYGKPLDSHNMGAPYGRLTPTCAAERKAGEWQHIDVILCDRHVTVTLNGRRIINNRFIRGITGGAMTSDEFKPGPICLQGDHDGGAYRRMILTPILKETKKDR